MIFYFWILCRYLGNRNSYQRSAGGKMDRFFRFFLLQIFGFYFWILDFLSARFLGFRPLIFGFHPNIFGFFMKLLDFFLKMFEFLIHWSFYYFFKLTPPEGGTLRALILLVLFNLWIPFISWWWWWYFCTATKGFSFEFIFTSGRVLSIHADPYQALSISISISISILVRKPILSGVGLGGSNLTFLRTSLASLIFHQHSLVDFDMDNCWHKWYVCTNNPLNKYVDPNICDNTKLKWLTLLIKWYQNCFL